MEKATVPRKRKDYLDVLRILATFAVVVLHVCASRWADVQVGSFAWNVLNIPGSLVR